MAKLRDPLEQLRGIIEAWPETREKLSHGAPTWWGGRKTFATFHLGHHGDLGPTLWVKSTHETQAELVEADAELFFVPPYVGVSGWLGVRLDRGADWEMIAGILEAGYRMVAPKRAIRALDEATGD